MRKQMNLKIELEEVEKDQLKKENLNLQSELWECRSKENYLSSINLQNQNKIEHLNSTINSLQQTLKYQHYQNPDKANQSFGENSDSNEMLPK